MKNALVGIEDQTTEECPEGAMAYITDMLGTAFRDKMMETLGGTEIKVPQYVSIMNDDHPLVRALGRIDADELVDTMAGEAFYVPHGNPPDNKLQELIPHILAGKKAAEIARDMGISQRHVRRLRSRVGLDIPTVMKRLGVSHLQVHEAIRAAVPLSPVP